MAELLTEQERFFEGSGIGRWTQYAGLVGAPTVSGVQQYSGLSSLRAEASGANAGILANINTAPGRELEFSGRVWSSASEKLCYCYIYFPQIPGGSSVIIPMTNQWRLFTLGREVPTGITFVQLILYFPASIAGDTFFFDALSLTDNVAAAVPSPVQEIVTKRFAAHARGRAMELNFSGEGTGVAPEVHEVSLEFYTRSR